MQRVRIGLTGLGFVFVAVLLAMALTSAPETEQAVTANGAVAPAPPAEENPKEPLAELGVTPGNADNGSANGSGNQVAPR